MHTGSHDPPYTLYLKIKGLERSVVHFETKQFHILPFVMADLFLYAGSLVLMDLQVTNSFFDFVICLFSVTVCDREETGPRHSPPCAADG